MPPKEEFPHVARAHAYARAVVAKKIPACVWVRLACKRHLADLKASKTKAFPFRFDPAKAERSCQFAELFSHVKGHWAIPQPGKPESTRIRLEDWQCFIRCSIRGWVEKSTGLRRFRTIYLEMPRKQGKSVLAATEGLESLAADGEPGAEVYSGATTEKQAWEVFRPALAMAKASPDFLDAYGVEPRTSNLAIPGNGSRFEPVIGKPGDGASPHLAIIDEYHEHPDPTQYDTMVTGMGARRQPLMYVITTAGDNQAGPCYEMHEQVTKVLRGTEKNERLFGVIYTIDEKDDWRTEAALRKANPNYGVSVSAEFLRQQQLEAIAQSSKQNIFKIKHLDIWVTARSPWLNMEWWHKAADPTLTRAAFAGEPCILGLDLASKIDMAAGVQLFPRTIDGEQHYFLFLRAYAPEDAVQDPSRRHYQGWVADGWLTATEGNEIDQEKIKADILEDARTFQVLEVAFDDWGAIKLAQELGAEGLTVVRIPQNVKHLSEPMKELEAAIKGGRVHHNGNPLLTWMMGNVTAKEDANENVFPRKERRENKIDGAVATIMAMARALAHPIGRSVYEDRGLLSL